MSGLGGKADALVRLVEANYPVPEFCVVEPQFMCDHLNASGLRGEPEASWGTRVRNTPMADCLSDWLSGHVPVGDYFAVRSSALVEDGAEDSFAGQFATRLNVPRAELIEAIREVWSSAFAPHVLSYAATRGAEPGVLRMGVIVQRMLAPEVSGVAFAVDPVTEQRDVAVVSAVYGLGEGLVSGDLDADRFEVRTSGAVCATLAHKPAQLVTSPGGGTVQQLVSAQERDLACLDDVEARRIAGWARELSAQAGCWQDIEWCRVEGDLWLLQSRPITGLRNAAPPGATLTVWDNANIIESYAGVTTPLTFSFVQDVYSRVYQLFFRFMGVVQSLIDANGEIFRMVGLIEGRIYYNLLNWYRALSLLPGYAINAKFMEQMMGVTDGFDVPPVAVQATGNRWWRLVRSVVGIVRSWTSLPRQVTDFHQLVDNTLSHYDAASLGQLDLHGLVDRYAVLESTLLNRWQTPLVNDFFAMVLFGTLRKLLAAWCPELDEEFQNPLLCAEQNIISTEPIERLNTIVAAARCEPELVRLARDRNAAKFLHALNGYSELQEQFDSLRQRFGARTLEELKLETITAIQDPTILAAQVMAYLNMQPQQSAGPSAQQLRAQAQERFEQALAGHPLRRRIGRWVLRQTRRLVAQRENLRFERTRVFDAARSIFLALGERLSAGGVIDTPRDVFWLKKDELFDFVRGTAVDVDLRGIGQQRRHSWSAYPQANVADRFETHGSPYVGDAHRVDPLAAIPLTDPHLKGTGCCAGRVTARALVVTDPREVTDLEGRILVAERTDPGWTPLFPLAVGILVARGSLLSHSAIVARELGKPAVVAVPGLLQQVRTGDLVSFDGSTGEISVVRDGQTSGAMQS